MKRLEKKKVKNPKHKKKSIIKPKKEKVLVVAQEFKFARLLSGNEKKTRDRVLKTLKKWLLNCFEKGYGKFILSLCTKLRFLNSKCLNWLNKYSIFNDMCDYNLNQIKTLETHYETTLKVMLLREFLISLINSILPE